MTKMCIHIFVALIMLCIVTRCADSYAEGIDTFFQRRGEYLGKQDGNYVFLIKDSCASQIIGIFKKENNSLNIFNRIPIDNWNTTVSRVVKGRFVYVKSESGIYKYDIITGERTYIGNEAGRIVFGSDKYIISRNRTELLIRDYEMKILATIKVHDDVMRHDFGYLPNDRVIYENMGHTYIYNIITDEYTKYENISFGYLTPLHYHFNEKVKGQFAKIGVFHKETEYGIYDAFWNGSTFIQYGAEPQGDPDCGSIPGACYMYEFEISQKTFKVYGPFGRIVATFRANFKDVHPLVFYEGGIVYLYIGAQFRFIKAEQIENERYYTGFCDYVSKTTKDGKYMVLYEDGRIETYYRNGELLWRKSVPEALNGLKKASDYGDEIWVQTSNGLWSITRDGDVVQISDLKDKVGVLFEHNGSRIGIVESRITGLGIKGWYTYHITVHVYNVDDLRNNHQCKPIRTVNDNVSSRRGWYLNEHFAFIGDYGVLYNYIDRKPYYLSEKIAIEKRKKDWYLWCRELTIAGGYANDCGVIYDVLRGKYIDESKKWMNRI